ncbi:GDP-mannose 4,6-dehydratase [Candidatus Woesebacteria bacterium]|nr:GDP-mannose 4,6-dehydratase [Candidatus Woesebacteria bacterium]
MKKILVTGAGGFVGTHLIRALTKVADLEVFATVYQSTSDIQSLLDSDHIYSGDLTNYEFTSTLIKSVMPDVIYHLAALSVVHNSHEKALALMNGNTTISYNLLEATRLLAPNARFVAICSANVYGAVEDTVHPISESTPIRPLNAYAVSKVMQEMLALQYYLAYALDVVILRPFNHTGPGQTTDFVIPRLAEQFAKIEQGKIAPIIEVGNLDSVRDFTDVRDMVEAYILAGEKAKSGEIYNIGSGKGYTVKQILEILETLSKSKVEIKVNQALVRASDVPVLIADSSKFSHLTDWKPKISLEETISDILDSYRNSK